jgi:hypothetical protein
MVAPLENFTGDPALDPLGRLAADWVGQAAARHGIRVVPTAEILLDLATAGLAPAGDERARAAAARFHADLLVTGHYTRVGGDLVIRAQVSDLRSGNLWGPVPAIRAPADSPGLALERIEQRVTGLLASQLRPGFPLEPATVLRPPTLEAYAAFLRATEPFIGGDYRAAIPHLTRAFELDSTFVRAALVAASAHWNAGDAAGADSIARLLAGRDLELAPYEAAHLRWLQASLAGDLGAALHAARAAADLAPGGPITGVAAGLALDLGRPRLALDLVNRMDPSHAQLPAYWDGRTRILHALGNHREERQHTSRARLRRFAAPRTRVRRPERGAQENARPSIEVRAPSMEPAGVESVTATGVIGRLSRYSPKSCGKRDRGTVTPTVTRLPMSDQSP